MCIRDSPRLPSIDSIIADSSPQMYAPAPRRKCCLLYTSDAADDLTRVDHCSRRFFQAEDGIRDLVRSRGLGDVYKRQPALALDRLDHRGLLSSDVRPGATAQM